MCHVRGVLPPRRPRLAASGLRWPCGLLSLCHVCVRPAFGEWACRLPSVRGGGTGVPPCWPRYRNYVLTLLWGRGIPFGRRGGLRPVAVAILAQRPGARPLFPPGPGRAFQHPGSIPAALVMPTWLPARPGNLERSGPSTVFVSCIEICGMFQGISLRIP